MIPEKAIVITRTIYIFVKKIRIAQLCGEG